MSCRHLVQKQVEPPDVTDSLSKLWVKLAIFSRWVSLQPDLERVRTGIVHVLLYKSRGVCRQLAQVIALLFARAGANLGVRCSSARSPDHATF
jgi:hypothetical protein